MADEIQHRLSGAFQAVVERYATEREDYRLEQGDETQPTGQWNLGDRATLITSDEASLQKAQQEVTFLQMTSVFVGAVRCGVLEVDHAKEPMAHFGRFGRTYDAVVRKLIDVLRDEGIYNNQAVTVQHIAGSAIIDVSDIDPNDASKLIFSVLQYLHGD